MRWNPHNDRTNLLGERQDRGSPWTRRWGISFPRRFPMRGLGDQLFAMAGIEPGGTNPWDIQIHDPGFYQRVWTGRNLGLGESYIEGWWDRCALFPQNIFLD